MFYIFVKAIKTFTMNVEALIREFEEKMRIQRYSEKHSINIKYNDYLMLYLNSFLYDTAAIMSLSNSLSPKYRLLNL